MKKRVLCLFLTLCMLFAQLPARALAAEMASIPPFSISLGEAHYHHGNDISFFTPTDANKGEGVYEGSVKVEDSGGGGQTISVSERAKFKTADALLQPFTIDVNVPALTRYVITFQAEYQIQRNSDGAAHYYFELFKAPRQDREPRPGSSGYRTDRYPLGSDSSGSGGSSLGRSVFSGSEGGTARRTFTLAFTNETGTETTIRYPMAYFTGTGASGSALAEYLHQTGSSVKLTAIKAQETNCKIRVDNHDGTHYFENVSDAVEEYNTRGKANPGAPRTMTLLQDVSGVMDLSRCGTIDLGGHTFTGYIMVREAMGAEDGSQTTIKNGTVDSSGGSHVAIFHDSGMPLVLEGGDHGLTAKSRGGIISAVHNSESSGPLTINSGVTIEPRMAIMGGGVTLNGGGPAIINTANEVSQIFVGAPITLGAALTQNYRVEVPDTKEPPVDVTTNWPGSDQPDSHFTYLDGKYHFALVSDGGSGQKVVAQPISVSFNANGGTVSPTGAAIQSGGTAAAWPTPTRPGYTFDGWFTSADGGTKHENSGFSTDITLYAHWKAKTVTVTFNANGGTVNPGSATVTYGSNYGGTFPTPTHDASHEFAGWYTAADGGVKVTEATPVTQADNHTLYAHWTKHTATYTVTLDLGGGTLDTGASKTLTVEQGKGVGILPTPTRAEFVFQGWYDAASGGNKVTASTVPTGDVTYYARWQEITHTVTFNANGGTMSPGSATMPVPVGGTVSSLPTPTRAGYTYEGWFTDLAGMTEFKTSTSVNADITLYAKWEAKKITVTFKPGDGGKIGESADNVTTICTYGQPYVFPDEEITNSDTTKKFVGWYVGDKQITGGMVCEETGSTLTLTAEWKENHSHTLHHTVNNETDFVTELKQSDFQTSNTSGSNGVTYGKVGSTYLYTLSTGCYYLAGDISISSTAIRPADNADVSLCLNGHTITHDDYSNGSFASAFNFEYSTNSSTLNICDCKGDGKVKSKYGECVNIDNGSTVNLYSGTFDACSYCVSFDSDGTSPGGTLNVYDAALNAEKYYGIVLAGYGSSNYSNVTLNGGRVTGGQYGVGGYQSLDNNHLFTLNNAPIIQGKIAGLYGAPVTVGTNLQGVFSVDGGALSEGDSLKLTTGEDEDSSDHFFLIPSRVQAGHCLEKVDLEGGKQYIKISHPHTHKVCGTKNACTHLGEAHAGPEKWTVLSDAADVSGGGSYYLWSNWSTSKGNIEIPAGKTVNLCLNGKSFNSTITVNGTLNLCSCQSSGTVQNTSSDPAIKISGTGTLNQYGGTVKAPAEPVILDKGGTYNLYGGELKSTSGNPKIVPNGTVNLMGGNANGATIEFTDSTGQAVNIGGNTPNKPYNITTSNGGVVNVTLPSGAAPSDYATGDLPPSGGGDTEPGFQLTIDGVGVVEVDGTSKKLSDAQKQTLEEIKRPGYILDGYYPHAGGAGDKIDLGTLVVSDSNITIYPKWTLCQHTGHSGTTIEIKASTCTAAGTESFTCSVCGAEVTRATALAEHTDGGWKTDADKHWKECSVCKQTFDEGPHTWDEGTESADGSAKTYACTKCGNSGRTETIPTYTVTFEAEGVSPQTVKAGKEFTLPTASRTGYTLDGWVLLDEAGAPVLKEDGTEDVLSANTNVTAPNRDAAYEPRWTREPSVTLTDGQKIVLEDGTTIENSGGSTIITRPDGGTTTITGGGSVTVTNDGKEGDKVSVPAGSTVTTTQPGGSTTVTIGSGGGTADPTGGVDAGAGTTVTTKDGTAVTINSGEAHIGPDGNVTFPPDPSSPGNQGGGKVTVKKQDGTTETIDVGGETEGVNPSTGAVPPYVPQNNVVQTGDTVITLPADEDGNPDPATGGVTDQGGGSLGVPGGSTVQTGVNGPEITVGDGGGSVKPNGDIDLPAGGSLSVPGSEDGTIEITTPGGGTVERKENGELVAPQGSTVTEKDENGNVTSTTDITDPGGQAVKPGGISSGTVLEPGNTVNADNGATITNNGDGTVTITKDGTTTTVTLPTGTTEVTVDQATGEVGVPSGSKVKTPPSDVQITVGPGNSGTVAPGGGVTPSKKGGSLTIDDGKGGSGVTIVLPSRDEVEPSGGGVSVPEGTVVRTTPAITVGPGNGGTVTPPGSGSPASVDVGSGGTVTVTGSVGTTNITTGSGGSVEPDSPGKIKVPGGSTIQTDGGMEITVSGESSVDPDTGKITTAPGSTVTIQNPDDAGTTEITFPAGGGEAVIEPHPNGTVTVPGGSTVTNKDTGGGIVGTPNTLPAGSPVTITPGSSTLEPGYSTEAGGATITNNDDGTVTITKGGTTTTVTLPEPGSVPVSASTGKVTLPGDSEVRTGGGPTVTVPDGGSVKPGGEVSGGTVEVGDTTVTVTSPSHGTVTADKDGNVTIPGGTTASVDEGGSTPATTVTVPGGGTGTVKPDGGIDLPAGSSVTIPGTGGGAGPEITVSTGGTVTPNPDGTITVPAGSTVTMPDGTSQRVDKESTVNPDGTIDGGGSGGETSGKITIDTQPSAPGGNPIGKSITVTASGGSGPLYYEWYYNDRNSTKGGTQTGGNSPTCTIPELEPGTYYFYCKITSGNSEPVTTRPVAIIIPAKGDLLEPGGSLDVPGATIERTNDGQTVTITPTPSGTPVTTITLPGDNPEGLVTVDKTTGNVTVPEGSTVKDEDPSSGKPALTTGTNGVSVTIDGKVDLPTGGAATVGGDGGKPIFTITGGQGGTTVTPEGDGSVAVSGGGNVKGGGGASEGIILPDGGTVDPTNGTVKPAGNTVNVGTNDDGDVETEIVLPGTSVPGGDTITLRGDGTAELPGGTEIKGGTGGDSASVTLPGGGTVTSDGGVAPTGGTAIGGDGGRTEISLPVGGAIKGDGEGGLTVPGGTTVKTDGSSSEIKVDHNDGKGGTITKDGGVELPGGGSATVTGEDGSGGTTTTTVTVPAGGGKVTPEAGSTISVSGGSTVQSGGGPEMGLPGGGKVNSSTGGVTPNPGGGVTIGVGGSGTDKVTITPPAGGEVTPKPGGTADIPSGSTVKSDGKDSPEINVPQGGTVDSSSGAVTAPEVEVNGTTITKPGPAGGPNGNVTTDKDGTTKVEPGTEIRNGDITVTVNTDTESGTGGGGKSTVDKDGTVTFPDGGEVTIQKGPQSTTTTIEKGGSISVNPVDASGVSGTVTEQDGATKVAGATVSLRQGIKKWRAPITGADGQYAFLCIPKGVYNIVAEEGERTKTELVELSGKDEIVNLKMPSEGVSSILEVGETEVKGAAAEVNKTVVGRLDEEAEEVKKEHPGATSVTVKMTVEAKAESEADNYSEIRQKAEEDADETVELEYLEIKVVQTVTETISVTTDITNTKTLLKIIIPFDSNDKEDVKVYRYHDDEVQTLSETSNADGEFIQVGNNRITLHVRKFSTYAISYKMKAENPPDPITPPAPSYSGSDYDDDDDDDDEPTYHPTVEKTGHGSVSVRPSNPKQGERVTITVKPDKGYEVDEVTVTDRNGDPIDVKDNGDGTYTFTQPKGKVTIAAAFRAINPAQPGYATCSKGGSCPIWPFADASPAAWYHDGVHYCIENGLMNGYADMTFKPDNALSRAQLAQILYNLEGHPASGGTSPFTDVANDAWCANAVIWANQRGIVGGYGNGTFGPNNPITRQQLAVMLWRYAQAKGHDVTVGEGTNILGYQDFDQISEYAIPALQWAVGAGVMKGKEGGLLDPTGRATRAQTAVMLQRYLGNAIQ